MAATPNLVRSGMNCTRLIHREVVRLDPEPLLRLHAGLGQQESVERIAQMRDRLIELVGDIEGEALGGGFKSVAERATRLAGVASGLGFPELERAALNLADCARGDDGTAFAATLARMLRLAEASVTEVRLFRNFAD